MKLDVYNLENAKVGEVNVSDAVFGAEVKPHLHHEVVRYQLAKRRQGTHKVKGRSEIARTSKKLYKQKGTGRARVGSARAPIRRGGGKAHGPTRRDFATSFNRRQRKMALRVVLSQKLREGRLTVVPSLNVEPRTRVVVSALRKRDMASALFVDDVIEEGLRRAVANAPRVDALPQIGANVYDILRRDHLVLSESAAFSLAGRLVGR